MADPKTPLEKDVLDLTQKTIDFGDRLAASERRFASIVERSSDGAMIIDSDGAVRFANPAAEAMLGRARGELVGQPVGFPVVAGDVAELELLKRERSITYAEMRVVETEWEGRPASLALLRDVTDRHRVEAELSHRATHDPLTGLPNRFLLDDRLTQALARVGRSGQLLAVLFTDLDRFKAVNDRFGHAVGDRVLVEAASRIQAVLRPTDTAARVGGDEFVIVCEVDDEATANAIARRLEQALVQPILAGDQQVTVGASVGLVLDAAPHSDAATLVARADEAMYRSKGRVGPDERR